MLSLKGINVPKSDIQLQVDRLHSTKDKSNKVFLFPRKANKFLAPPRFWFFLINDRPLYLMKCPQHEWYFDIVMHLKNISCLQLPITLMIFTICPMTWSLSSKLQLMFYLFMITKSKLSTPNFDNGARIKSIILNFNHMKYDPLSCDRSWKSLETCF